MSQLQLAELVNVGILHWLSVMSDDLIIEINVALTNYLCALMTHESTKWSHYQWIACNYYWEIINSVPCRVMAEFITSAINTSFPALVLPSDRFWITASETMKLLVEYFWVYAFLAILFFGITGNYVNVYASAQMLGSPILRNWCAKLSSEIGFYIVEYSILKRRLRIATREVYESIIRTKCTMCSSVVVCTCMEIFCNSELQIYLHTWD